MSVDLLERFRQLGELQSIRALLIGDQHLCHCLPRNVDLAAKFNCICVKLRLQSKSCVVRHYEFVLRNGNSLLLISTRLVFVFFVGAVSLAGLVRADLRVPIFTLGSIK